MAYVIVEEKRDFISLTGGGLISRPAFAVYWEEDGKRDASRAIERVAASSKPMHIASAKRNAGVMKQRLEAHLSRTGKRWEVERREEAAAKRAAERAAAESRARVRAAAPHLLEALREQLEWLREGRDTGLTTRSRDEMIAAARAAIAKAEG